jgi:hypothetical protein
MTGDGGRIPPMRASDAERDAVVAALGEHFQAGRLTSEELDDRMGRALAARTLPELADLTADLPSSGLPSQGPQSSGLSSSGLGMPAPTVLSRRPGSPLRQVVVPAVAVILLVLLVLKLVAFHDALGAWVVIPAAVLIARRVARRGNSRRRL